MPAPKDAQERGAIYIYLYILSPTNYLQSIRTSHAVLLMLMIRNILAILNVLNISKIA
jgi:hypothetical protein